MTPFALSLSLTMGDRYAFSSADRGVVDTALGFAVPDAFLKLLNLVSRSDGAVAGDRESIFRAVTGLTTANQNASCPGTPPELFLIGSTELDDVNCGCVIHDPHLGHEYPLAMYQPADARGDYLGLDFRRSLGTLMGIAWREIRHSDDLRKERVRDVIEKMQFDPDELPAEPPLGLHPRTPPGWKFAATADGLGVMAPALQFTPDQDFDEEPDSFERLEIEDYIKPAHALLKKGFPASALWHLRNGFTFWAADGLPESLTTLMAESYCALGRDFLVIRLNKEIALHSI